MALSPKEMCIQAEIQDGGRGVQVQQACPGSLSPCVFVVFGASGDLAMRKLFPALFHLFASGHLPERFAIVGTGRTPFESVRFREQVGRSLPGGETGAKSSLEEFLRRVSYHALSYDKEEDYDGLAKLLESINASLDAEGNRLFYLAVPHAMFRHILEGAISSNRLVLGIHPDEGASLSFQAKQPGMHSVLRSVNMRFDYNQEGRGVIKDAYLSVEKVTMRQSVQKNQESRTHLPHPTRAG